VGPVPHSNGCDGFGPGGQSPPCVAGCVYDGVVIFKDGVRDPVLAEILPDVLDWVQLRGPRRQEDRRDVFGHVELVGNVPPSPVEKHHGVCALGDVARYFVEMELHHVCIGIGKRQGRSDTPRWADRAEQIGVVIALVGGLPWPRSSPGPLPNLAVLLADPGFVLEPDFDRRRLGQPFEMGLQRAREVFLKASTVRSS
jgi:hypothetical protein